MMIEAIRDFSSIEKALIFGSRAMGNYKKGSDIDLAVFGHEIDRQIVLKLHGRLNEELPIPYYVDVVHFDTLSSEALKEHIMHEGKIIYEKKA